jgi:hypothetical protein
MFSFMTNSNLYEQVQELYRLYPKHIGKRAAITAIRSALRRLPFELQEANRGNVGDPIEWLKEQISAFAESPAGQRGRLTPYPSTWFNQSRYLDDQEVWHEMTPQEEKNMRLYAEKTAGMWRPQ